ncbi:hypothetical protein GGD38_004553 [Chitinophagaceae bacterium OAS944]|nr:hypothetical protein [Chitinophagaceae bacterium OAS944]
MVNYYAVTQNLTGKKELIFLSLLRTPGVLLPA